MLRVLVWHQSNLVSHALAGVLDREEGFGVHAASGEIDRFLGVAAREAAHVAVVDHETGPLPISDTCRQLTRELPELRILVLLSAPACQRFGADLVRLAPALGLMDTSSTPEDLVHAVRRLADGDAVLDGHLAVAALKADRNPLTQREREVLRIALEGAPIPDIADRLCLSNGTVRNYLAKAMTKTGARTRIEAIRNAERAGWI